jgi:hypothetical protein
MTDPRTALAELVAVVMVARWHLTPAQRDPVESALAAAREALAEEGDTAAVKP